jgi:uncharacterized protein (TIGR02147 family)
METAKTTAPGPNIFEYDDYRKYLRDWYAYSKERLKAFSFRYFSRQAGFQSPNFLKLVMEGQRNLSGESIDRFVKVMKLDRAQSAYFRHLVLMNQAASFEEKSFYAEQLLSVRPKGPLKILAQAQYSYLSNWYNVPIREMVALRDFREDPEWIASRLSPSIKPAEAKKALEELQLLGLLKRDPDGRLVEAEGQVGFGDEIRLATVVQFHRSMMSRASEALDRVRPEEREVSGVTLAIGRDKVAQVKSLIQKFRKELLALGAEVGDAETVYQANFQFFPLTKAEGRKEAQA